VRRLAYEAADCGLLSADLAFDQYRTRAEGSAVPLHAIQHTLLNTESRTADMLAATITVLLSLFWGLALWQFIVEWRRGEAAK
jgi:hypothetical protein